MVVFEWWILKVAVIVVDLLMMMVLMVEGSGGDGGLWRVKEKCDFGFVFFFFLSLLLLFSSQFFSNEPVWMCLQEFQISSTVRGYSVRNLNMLPIFFQTVSSQTASLCTKRLHHSLAIRRKKGCVFDALEKNQIASCCWRFSD
jgi:hypothetical protein